MKNNTIYDSPLDAAPSYGVGKLLDSHEEFLEPDYDEEDFLAAPCDSVYESGYCPIDEFVIKIKKKGYAIVEKYLGSDSEVIVPCEYEGAYVREIADEAFIEMSHIERVVLPWSLAIIGNGAFSGAASLREITLPSGLLDIKETAFMNCRSLETVDIPASVKHINKRAFYGCTALREVKLHYGLHAIGALAFAGCKSLAELSLPDSVSILCREAFSRCSKLSAVKLSLGLTRLGVEVFNKCSSLVRIDIPNGIKQISSRAFMGCGALREIRFSSELEGISSQAFSECVMLRTLEFPEKLHAIGNYAFSACINLEEVKLKGYVIMGKSPFRGCDKLKTEKYGTGIYLSTASHKYGCLIGISTGASVIEVHSECVTFGEDVFSGNSTLTAVKLSKSKIAWIPDGAFADCRALKRVELPRELRHIGSSAFMNCALLGEIKITEGVGFIAADAFKNCQSLHKVKLPRSVTFISRDAFAGCQALSHQSKKAIDKIING